MWGKGCGGGGGMKTPYLFTLMCTQASCKDNIMSFIRINFEVFSSNWLRESLKIFYYFCKIADLYLNLENLTFRL